MKELLFEKIDQYFNGELSPEEQQQFELELSTNPELASAYDLYKTIETEMVAIHKHSDEKAVLNKNLQKLNTVYFKRDTNEDSVQPSSGQEESSVEQIKPPSFRKGGAVVKRMKLWKGWMVAATVTGVVVLSAVWYVKSTKNNPEAAVDFQKADGTTSGTKPDTFRLKRNAPPENLTQQNKSKETEKEKTGTYRLSNAEQATLYARNFQPDPAPENQEGPLEDAFDYYQHKDYKNAIAAFQSADVNIVLRGQKTDKKISNFYLHYYTAQSYLAENNTARAIPELEKSIVLSRGISQQHAARWYLALACLKTGNLERTEDLLAQIVESSKRTTYTSKAGALMSTLKK